MKVSDHHNIVRVDRDATTGTWMAVEIIGLQHYEDACREYVAEDRWSAADALEQDWGAIEPTKDMKARELSEWADHFLDSHRVSDSSREEPATSQNYDKTTRLLEEGIRIMQLANFLVEKQQAFLTTGDWMDKCQLTYLDVAKHNPQWSETTIRRTIKELRLKVDHSVYAATELICSNSMPEICKVLVSIMEEHPKAGSPKLRELLLKRGIAKSQRFVGSALALIRQWERRKVLYEYI